MLNPQIAVAGKQLNEIYNSQEPFPHLVFDNFLDETVARDAAFELKWLNDNAQQEEWRFNEKDHHQDQALRI